MVRMHQHRRRDRQSLFVRAHYLVRLGPRDRDERSH
jgi:hypothetical protein